MSDPVSSMDVEDVLSSIRRLVSEEAKGTDPQEKSEADESRVDDTPQGGDAIDELVQAFEGSAEESPKGTPPSNELNEEDDSEEPEELQASFRHQAAKAAIRAKEQKLVLTEALRVAVPDHSPNDKETDGQEEAETSSAKAADNTGKVTPHPHLRAVRNESSPESRIQSTAFRSAPEEALFDRVDQELNSLRSEDKATEDVLETAEPVELASEYLEEIEDTEEVSAESSEPEIDDSDAPEEPAISASPFASAGGAFSEVQEAEEVDHVKEASTINFAEEDSPVLDEETLRDLVSEMVRDELQGELGDRITRNVRKLVRREIQRSLASREFE